MSVGVTFSSNIIRVIKSRRLSWTGHVASIERGEVHKGFRWENLRKVDYLEGPGIDWRIILKWILEKWDGDMDWMDLAQDRDRWRAFMDTVMNLWVP
jgi:hypothetical protein